MDEESYSLNKKKNKFSTKAKFEKKEKHFWQND